MIVGKKGLNNNSEKTSNTSEKADSAEDLDLNINFTIGAKVITDDVDKLTKIPPIERLNPTMLMNMLAENPNVHSRWNTLYGQASFDADMQKMRFEVWQAKKSKEVRLELASVEKGRVTDKMVQETILTDPEYDRRFEKVMEAERNQRQIYAMAMGIGKKGERLKDIAFMMRFEGETLVEGKQAIGRRVRHDDAPRGRKSDEPVVGNPSINGGWPTA